MTPPGRTSGPNRITQPAQAPEPSGGFNWETVGKILLSAVGALLTLAFASAASELKELKSAVYSSQERTAVVEERVKSLQSDSDKTQKRVENLEYHVFRGTK